MIPFTEEQKERFVVHLTTCHSWHKHLPLVNGGQFIFTTDRDSGLGYPTQHPKLPFGNNMSEYQKAFGQLIYYWKTEKEQFFQTDGQLPQITLADIELRYHSFSSVNLFPYLSYDFEESISFHREDINKLEILGHEQKDILQSIHNKKVELDSIWQDLLTEDERNTIDNKTNFNTNNINTYISLERKMNEQLKSLREFEINKIRTALNKITLRH